MNTKTCSKCEQVLQRDVFYKQPRNSDGLHSYCIDCDKEASVQWHFQNRDNCSFYENTVIDFYGIDSLLNTKRAAL